LDDMRGPTAPTRSIVELASRQFGVVSRRDLAAAGLRAGAIDRRIASGLLVPLHRGVYAVGHTALRREGRWLAAVLACGPDAVLSHRSAARAAGVRHADPPFVEVTSPRGRGRGRRGLVVHEGRLTGDDVMLMYGVIPITTLERTLLDVAEVEPPRELERQLDRAVQLRRYDGPAIDATIARAHGRHGIRPLAAALARIRPEQGATRSWLERLMLVLAADRRIPPPEANVWVAGREVDLLWPTERLVVELDSHAFHTSPAAFEQDRRRDVELRALGYTVYRFTWRQITREPQWVAGHVARALASAPQPGRARAA
ncbi:MAG: type IV toxin-antitoxin system AbiEi family antitoxin domain-containing protein, partial [Candidatus Binatia bacterium]